MKKYRLTYNFETSDLLIVECPGHDENHKPILYMENSLYEWIDGLDAMNVIDLFKKDNPYYHDQMIGSELIAYFMY